MPCSTWTTRSPGLSAVVSRRKFSALRRRFARPGSAGRPARPVPRSPPACPPPARRRRSPLPAARRPDPARRAGRADRADPADIGLALDALIGDQPAQPFARAVGERLAITTRWVFCRIRADARPARRTGPAVRPDVRGRSCARPCRPHSARPAPAGRQLTDSRSWRRRQPAAAIRHRSANISTGGDRAIDAVGAALARASRRAANCSAIISQRASRT
jgi:hypothetical protein